jgi:hypothetical protein
MKLSFSSKTFSTIGLMALLVATIGTSIPRTVQAQSRPQPPEFTEEEIATFAAACDRAYKENAEVDAEGNSFYDTLRAMNVTDQLRNAYNTLSEQADAKRFEIYENSVSVPDPTAALSFMWFGDPDPTIEPAIQATLDRNPEMDQADALNQQFGKYGVFLGSYFQYYTPEQDAQMMQITKDFDTQFEALLTPEQKRQYRENLADGERIRVACEWEGPISSYPSIGRISDTIPEGMITETRERSIEL